MFPTKQHLTADSDASSLSETLINTEEDKHNSFKIDKNIFTREDSRTEDMHL